VLTETVTGEELNNRHIKDALAVWLLFACQLLSSSSSSSTKHVEPCWQVQPNILASVVEITSFGPLEVLLFCCCIALLLHLHWGPAGISGHRTR